jgi:hypothetical protein
VERGRPGGPSICVSPDSIPSTCADATRRRVLNLASVPAAVSVREERQHADTASVWPDPAVAKAIRRGSHGGTEARRTFREPISQRDHGAGGMEGGLGSQGPESVPTPGSVPPWRTRRGGGFSTRPPCLYASGRENGSTLTPIQIAGPGSRTGDLEGFPPRTRRAGCPQRSQDASPAGGGLTGTGWDRPLHRRQA